LKQSFKAPRLKIKRARGDFFQLFGAAFCANKKVLEHPTVSFLRLLEKPKSSFPQSFFDETFFFKESFLEGCCAIQAAPRAHFEIIFIGSNV